MANLFSRDITIIRFLQILGVGEKTTKLDAEGIEHHVHKDTINRMERFVDYAEQHPSWLQQHKPPSRKQHNSRPKRNE